MSRATGSAAIIRDEQGRVLLVRHTYGLRNWSLPGGHAAAGESPAETAVREVKEETGLDVRPVRLVGIYYDRHTGAQEFLTFDFECVLINPAQGPAPDLDEVSELGFWPVDNLPKPVSNFTIRRLAAQPAEHGLLPETIPPRVWHFADGLFLSACLGGAVRLRAADPAEVARAGKACSPASLKPTAPDTEISAGDAQCVLADDSPQSQYYVAETASTQEFVGLMSLDRSRLARIWVEPGWRRRGIGATFVHLAQCLRPDGLELWLPETHRGAGQFFERQGFVALDVADPAVQPSTRRYGWHPMRMALDGLV